MTSAEEESLEGDGPERFDMDKSEDSKWANLPAPVFCKLFSQMSSSFVYTARQVCPTWLSYIENEVGLSVKVDDNLEGNIEFVQSVKVIQARIVNLRGNSSSSDTESISNVEVEPSIFLFPTCLQKLVVTGKLPQSWRIKSLLEFPNLEHLVLRGTSLHSQDMTGYPLPEPPTVSDSNPEAVSSTLDGYEPVIEPQSIWLKNLRKLEVIMNEFSYPSALPLSVRLNDPEHAIRHELRIQRLFNVVLNNVSYILNNVRSRHLHVVQVYVYPKAGTIPPAKLNWRHVPLQRFLDHHKKTLKELYLPDFEGKHDNTDADLTSFPTRLKKLQLTLSKFVGDREEGRVQDNNYWKQVLSEQKCLQDIYLITSDLNAEWNRDCISSLAFSSKESLIYVDIVIQDTDAVFMNLEIFAFCHNLQILKLSGRDTEIVLRNFCKLPCSLKKVYMSMAFVEIPDPEFVEKFENLEMMELKTVLAGDGHARTPDVLRKLFELRKLSLLALTFDSPMNSNRHLIEILDKLDDDYDSSYPSFMLKMHLAYELEGGWGEETFDEEKLDIEYINAREPEEYSTWHSRHRNAISVDDEDHRIFIFQTLPFLLDIRGRRFQMGGDDSDADDDDDDDAVAHTPDSVESRASTIPDDGNQNSSELQDDDWD